MPYAVMLYLDPDGDDPATSAAGVCAHAAFLSLVRGIDASLAERLHDEGARKPFTVWMTRTRSGAAAPQRRALRLSLLDDQLFPPIAGGFLTRDDLRLRIGAAQYRLTELATHPAAHHLAGFATYEELRAAALPVERLALRFVTPTVFRSQKRDILWPDPHLLLQSWVRAWNAYAGEGLWFPEDQIAADLAPRVRTTRQRIETRRASLGDGVISGFVGEAALDLRGLSSGQRRQIAALAALSFYSGTGRKTTMGLGQTRPTGVLTHTQASRTL